jgi:hypothetical protein
MSHKNKTNFYVSVATHFTVLLAIHPHNAKNAKLLFVIPIQFNAVLAIAGSVSV